MEKHANISFFVPHLGCPHMCSFCNQHSITGKEKLPDKDEIDKGVKIAVNSKKYCKGNTEIAFFGGSFTAIDRDYMVYLLSCAYPYVKNGTVKGIRVSTRPDAIDDEILCVLREYGVTSIELGAQSTDEKVLIANNRGHSAEDIVSASNLIKDYGFSLGLQMMTGLYKSTYDSDKKTVLDFIKIKPDTVRIYPTIVLENTELATLYKKGEYIPPSLNKSIINCSEFYEMFSKHNIRVIRLGLHNINEDTYVAGPWHPAFSQLCMSNIYYENVKKALLSDETKNFTLYVNPSEISNFVGQKRSNINKFKDMGFFIQVVGNEEVNVGDFRLEREVK